MNVSDEHVEQYKNLCRFLASKIISNDPAYTQEDGYQIALMGLCKAFEPFDSPPPITFIYNAIKYELFTNIRTKYKVRQSQINFEDLEEMRASPFSKELMEEHTEYLELLDTVKKALKKTPQGTPEHDWLQAIINDTPFNGTESSKKYNCTRQNVNRRIQIARKKLLEKIRDT